MSDTPEELAPTTEPVSAPAADTPALPGALDEVKSRFGDALAEVRAGADALKRAALERTGLAYDAVGARMGAKSADWAEEARTLADQAQKKGLEIAYDGKSRASDVLLAVSKGIIESAQVIDAKLGVAYGDYARGAAKSLEDTAAKLETKEFAELGEDVKQFVRNNPGTTVGIAALAGFVVARALAGRGSADRD